MQAPGTFAGGVVACGISLAILAAILYPAPILAWAWIPLVALTLYGEWRAPYLPGYGALNFSEAIYFAVALEQGTLQAALMSALVGLAADLIRKKTPAVRMFNIGWSLCTFSAVGIVAHAMHYEGITSWPAILGALATYLVIAGGLQAGMESRLHHLPLSRTVQEQWLQARYSVLNVLSLGGMAIVLLPFSPWLVTLLMFPIEMMSALIDKDRLHRELVASQKALIEAEKRSALGTLAAGLAHELNTPLGAILVNCHMLRDPRMTLEDRAICLKQIEHSTQRGRQITEGLLSALRPRTDTPRSDLRKALEDAVTHVQAPFPIAIPAGDYPIAMAHHEAFQVLQHLLRNALQAGATHIHLSVEPVRSATRLHLTDNASGIPDDIQPRIWDPFFTTQPPGSGMGLGLFVARNIIESSGGHISLLSSTSQGTTFQIDWPS